MTPDAARPLRADLHVHSCHSLQSGNLKFLKSRDCYSSPEAVYSTARDRGMDVVTITDHDSIGGCLEFLDRHPDATDFFISEEVSCTFPDAPIEVHLGVYGMTEALHARIQPLRRNVWEVAAALREARVFFALNHLFYFYRAQLPLADYMRLVDAVPALEVRNGTMLAVHNELAEQIAREWRAGRRFATAGSDAHTLRRIGRTWTSAPGRTASDFLESLTAGRAEVGGEHGNATAIAADAYGVIGRYVASLAGFGPRDHGLVHRALCLLFSTVSAPAQFLPLAIAASGKRRERDTVRRVSLELAAAFESSPDAIAGVEA